MEFLKVAAVLALMFIIFNISTAEAGTIDCYYKIGTANTTCTTEKGECRNTHSKSSASATLVIVKECVLTCDEGTITYQDGSSVTVYCCATNLCNAASAVQTGIVPIVLMVAASLYYL